MYLLSLVWALIVYVRNRLFDRGWLRQRSFPLPVICVGNLAVGGTGKTPHVEYLLRLLHAEGYRVAMLSRGYGRRTKGYLLAREGLHTARDIGDEPYQMLKNCPFATVAVCEKRVVGIERLLQLKDAPDVIVLDDAYQHRYVKAGLNILLTDAARPYHKDHLLPYGRLREPATAAKRADLVIVTKCRETPPQSAPALLPHQQLFYSRIVYGQPRRTDGTEADVTVEGRSVLLLTGIANPQPLKEFEETEQGAAQVTLLAFRDHHAYTAADVRKIEQAFLEAKADLVLTTQKDAARLSAVWPLFSAPLKARLYVQPIEVAITAAENQESFNQTILEYVRKNKRNRRMD